MKLTWFGTASIMLEIKDEKLLFDPFFAINKKMPKPELEQFYDVDYIFNTHSHFDHLCDIPKILPFTKACVYGTPTMKARLMRQDVNQKQVFVLENNDSVRASHALVTAYNAKHVKNDERLIIKTAVWGLARLKFVSAHKVLSLHNDYPMGEQIYSYLVEAGNKRVLIFGSAGIDENQPIPKSIDVLVWPFQGRSNMTKYSLPIIEKINPKVVILDHFDNAFPPITSTVSTKKFVNKMQKLHPEIKVIVPEYGQAINL